MKLLTTFFLAHFAATVLSANIPRANEPPKKLVTVKVTKFLIRHSMENVAEHVEFTALPNITTIASSCTAEAPPEPVPISSATLASCDPGDVKFGLMGMKPDSTTVYQVGLGIEKEGLLTKMGFADIPVVCRAETGGPAVKRICEQSSEELVVKMTDVSREGIP